MLNMIIDGGDICAVDPVAGTIHLGTTAEASDLVLAILALVDHISLPNLAGGGDSSGYFLEYPS